MVWFISAALAAFCLLCFFDTAHASHNAFREQCNSAVAALIPWTYRTIGEPSDLDPFWTSCTTMTYGDDGDCPTEFSEIYSHKWYTFFGIGKSVTVTTEGSNFDTRISVFRGSSCSSLVCIDFDDDWDDGDDRVTFFAFLGSRYYVRVDDYSCDEFDTLYGGSDAITVVNFETPTPAPTNRPTNKPTKRPTVWWPTDEPTNDPTDRPTPHPTPEPGAPTTAHTKETSAPTPSSAANRPTTTSTASSKNQNGGSSSGGGGVPAGVIGGVVGGLVAVVAAVVGLYCYRRKKGNGDGATAAVQPTKKNDEETPPIVESPTADEADEPDVFVPTPTPEMTVVSAALVGEDEGLAKPPPAPATEPALAPAAPNDEGEEPVPPANNPGTESTTTSEEHAPEGDELNLSVPPNPPPFAPSAEPTMVSAEPILVVHAPPGPLGLTMSSTRGPNSGHLIEVVKPNSSLKGQVQVGDELMAVDAVDLTQQSMREMTETLRSTASAARELTLRRVSSSGQGDV